MPRRRARRLFEHLTSDMQPPSGGVFAVALEWIQATLLGSLATTVAVIAVACVGLLLLSGRVDVRRGVQVVFGCFILFGAASIAAGIVRVAAGENSQPPVSAAPPPPPIAYVAPATPRPAPPVPYDPYAGAALPTHR